MTSPEAGMHLIKNFIFKYSKYLVLDIRRRVA